MASLNKVMLLGNLTRDPEMRWSAAGRGVCKSGLAVNRTWKSADGVRQEDTAFVDLVVFGRAAETFHQYMRKGRAVLVEGRLSYSSWESDGQRRSKLEVVVERFQFLSPRPEQPAVKKEGGGRYGEHPELDGKEVPF